MFDTLGRSPFTGLLDYDQSMFNLFNRRFTSSVKRFTSRQLQPARMSSTDVTYEELVQLQKNKTSVIVDVREQSEIEETGRLPGSIHIPLGELKTALEVSDTDFKCAHGVDKPKFDTPIVFSCKAGRRGQTATEKAAAMGFTNARNFEGGWLNWEKSSK